MAENMSILKPGDWQHQSYAVGKLFTIFWSLDLKTSRLKDLKTAPLRRSATLFCLAVTAKRFQGLSGHRSAL
jgi:hypothetical protein